MSKSWISSTGLLVRCTFLVATTEWLNIPGRHCLVVAINGPLLAKTKNSACWRNLPIMGRQEFLFQTTILRHVQPAPCTASVNAGSCLQSENTSNGAPSLAMRQHSDSQSVHQVTQLRWSLLSPNIGGYVRLVPDVWYFWAGSCWRAEIDCPPLAYGGSVRTISTLKLGRVWRTLRQSPWYRDRDGKKDISTSSDGHLGARSWDARSAELWLNRR